MLIGITGGIGSGKSVIARQLRQMGYVVYDTDSEAKRIIMEDAHVRAQITALFGSQAYKDGVYQTAFVAQQVFNANSPSPNSPSPNPLLARLNAIVHPAVKADIISKFRSSGVLISPKGSNDYSQANVQELRSSGVTSEPSEQAQSASELLNLSTAPKAQSASEPLNSSSAASEPSELFFIECAILYTAHLDELCDKVVVVTAPEEVRLARTIARDHSDIDKVRARMRAQSTEEDLRRADIVIHNDGTTPIPQLCEEIIHLLTK